MNGAKGEKEIEKKSQNCVGDANATVREWKKENERKRKKRERERRIGIQTNPVARLNIFCYRERKGKDHNSIAAFVPGCLFDVVACIVCIVGIVVVVEGVEWMTIRRTLLCSLIHPKKDEKTEEKTETHMYDINNNNNKTHQQHSMGGCRGRSNAMAVRSKEGR